MSHRPRLHLQRQKVSGDAGEHEIEPAAPPELADVWVWGVRQVAGVIGSLLLTARGLVVLLIVFKGVIWAITQNPNELRDGGIALAGFVALWVGGLILSRFAAERDVLDPSPWFFRRRR